MGDTKRTLWNQPELDNPAAPSNRGESFKEDTGQYNFGCADPLCGCHDEQGPFGAVRPPRELVGIEGDNGAGENLISSFTNKATHLPAIDIDMPIRCVPSKTEGHFHLFIEKELSWNQYADLLNTLERVGIVEPGYARAALAAGMTFVRSNPQSRPERDAVPTEEDIAKVQPVPGGWGMYF